MIVSFHYGNFTTARDTYGDDTIQNAAKNGRIYANTSVQDVPSIFGTFTATSTSTQTTYTWTPNSNSTADLLIVAGGGGGGAGGPSGSCEPGGGGAGGVLFNQNELLSNNTSYTIVVGNGGSGGNATTSGLQGGNSSYANITAIGGGGGQSSGTSVPGIGGSGGGGRHSNNGASGTTNQGNAGGGGTSFLGINGTYSNAGGGGGGAGEAGNTQFPTHGGNGLYFPSFINMGNPAGWFGGGGQGGAWDTQIYLDNPFISKGGGGKSNPTRGVGTPTSGVPHTGGGGGGAHYCDGAVAGGAGGSGIVAIMLQYEIQYPTDYKVHLDANVFSEPRLDNTTISSWSGYTAVNAGSGLPIVRTDEQFRYVRFGTADSSSTKGNYLNLGTQTWLGKENPRFISNIEIASDYNIYGWDIKTSTKWVANASSEFSANDTPAWKGFKKTNIDHIDCWLSDVSPSVEHQWLQITYPIPVVLQTYSITSRNDSTFTRFPSKWKAQGSNDNSIWVDLEPVRNEETWNSNIIKTYTTNVSGDKYIFYRLLITESRVSSSDSSISGQVAIGNWSLYTNIGFTAVGVIRFWAVKDYQRWFDFGNGPDNLNILWTKFSTTNTQSIWEIRNTILNSVNDTVPVGNGWHIVIARATSATLIEQWANPTAALEPRYATTGTITNFTARSLTNNWIGRSNWSADSYACLDIRETSFYDYALSDSELEGLVSHLRAKYAYDPQLQISGLISLGDVYSVIKINGIRSIGNFRNKTLPFVSAAKGVITSGSLPMSEFYGLGYAGHPTSIPNLYAWYTPDSFTSSMVWEDISGNNRHTILTKGTITVGTSTDPSGRSIRCIFGNTSAGLRFPTSVLPPTYTLFHLTRYTGGARGRIMEGAGGNWLDGFHGGRSGVAFHEAWLTEYINRFGDNWVLSSSQNRIYRANGIQRNTALPAGSTNQLTINYHASRTEFSDWACAEVIVYDRLLSVQEIELVERHIRNSNGLEPTYGLDGLSDTAKNTLVAAYSFRRCVPSYTGPTVRVRRSTDNAEVDFYATVTGVLHAGSMKSGITLGAWLGTATGFIRTWYDQSGRSKHAEQATIGSQPQIVISADGDVCMHLQGSIAHLAGPNVFDTTTPSGMHWVSASKEISRTTGTIISLNGDTSNFSISAPSDDGLWYADWDANNKIVSDVVPTSIGKNVVFSGYMSSASSEIGFRINGDARYLFDNITRTFIQPTIEAGIRFGGINTTDHHIFSFFVFSEKLGDADEKIVEQYSGLSKYVPYLQIGALDSINVYDGIVGAYALRRLFKYYTGPQVRVARIDNGAQADIFYDQHGSVYNVSSGTDLTTFAGGSALRIVTWYDQSGKNNNGSGVSSPLLDTRAKYKHSINLNSNRYISIPSTNDLIINGSTTPFWAYMAFHGDNLLRPNSLLSRMDADGSSSAGTDYRFWTAPYEQWTYGTGSAANTNAWLRTGITGGELSPCVMAGSHLPSSSTKGFYLRRPNSGTLTAFRNTSGKYTTSSTSRPVYIGQPNHGFIGRVYEVLIYRKDMTNTLNDLVIDNLANRYTNRIFATGGTITEVNGYRIHTFTSSGTFTVDFGGEVEYLIVAGGGAGGTDRGGGGGAGGVLAGNFEINNGQHSIVIGSGGASSSIDTSPGGNGGNTTFASLTAIGGGGGGSERTLAGNGGSGGGASYSVSLSAFGTGTSGQGFQGGEPRNLSSAATNRGGGGGGGASEPGQKGTSTGAKGGNGISTNISGTLLFYGGGGGAGDCRDGTSGGSSPGTGGAGGGGNGGIGANGIGQNGAANTGGGGGGGGYFDSGLGGNGGSGIVIIRYLL